MAAGARRLRRILADHVSDERVLRAMGTVRRELFLPPDLRDRADHNGPLPIGWGQTISQPVVVARMAAALDLSPGDRVLDVGTGSGYHAAVLAQLTAHVVTVERITALSAHALSALRDSGAANVTCLAGDATALPCGPERFGAINVAAAAPAATITRLAGLLAPGGRLVAPLQRGRHQHLVLVRRQPDCAPDSWDLLEPVRFVPLISDAGAPARGQAQRAEEAPGPQ